MMDLTDEDSLDWMARGRRGATAESTSGESHVNDTFGTVDAATRYQEGDKVELDDGERGLVVEVWTSGEREGPDGETYQASDDSPVYIVATETEQQAIAVPASDLKKSDWSTDVDDPTDELADAAEAMHAQVMAALPDDVDPVEDGTLQAGVTDWDYPESWTESDIPARLILLDAWSSMGGQFDCGGGCCMGTMMQSGMPRGRAAEFCASMKDRVLMWEGWRQGG